MVQSLLCGQRLGRVSKGISEVGSGIEYKYILVPEVSEIHAFNFLKTSHRMTGTVEN